MESHPAQAPVALIAGAGQFPVLVAQEARRQGHTVIGFGIEGWADPAFARAVHRFEPLHVGALGVLLQKLHAHGARHVMMAGKVTKEVLFRSPASLDAEMKALLGGLPEPSVNAILGAVTARLAKEGITVIDSSAFLASSLCPAGVLTRRQPGAAEQQDIQCGVRMARAVAELDIGQTVVIKQRVVVAVEALEGTDAAIRRACQLAGTGLVVVKVASPRQDMRFDVPVLGSATLAVLSECGVGCMAVEAGKTLLLERPQLIIQADAAGLCLVGVKTS